MCLITKSPNITVSAAMFPKSAYHTPNQYSMFILKPFGTSNS